MGVEVLPFGEPNPLHYATIGAYAKAYIDWQLAIQLRPLEERLAAIERAGKGAKP